MEQLAKVVPEFEAELRGNILPFWMKHMVDDQNGGFYGQMTGDKEIIPDAPKGAIMYARILWTFSSAYRLLGNEEYLTTAERAKDYLLSHFYDREFGGIYWSLTSEGQPLDTKKQIYALGFAIYGLSEYYRATNNDEALAYAVKLFEDIERHSFDSKNKGYVEALARDWSGLEDVRLSTKDANEKKTMNTHLHILEPYTKLYRIWKDEGLKQQLAGLIEIFLEKIKSPETHHLGLFFDEEWNLKSTEISYGHDIEASWLLLEAALAIEDDELIEKVKEQARVIGEAAMEGLLPDGSMAYEKHGDGRMDTERHWWVQAEAVVGQMWLYKYQKDDKYLTSMLHTWQYIKDNLIDYAGREWFWSVREDGTVNHTNDKAGFWKCPYHNGRMCIEVISAGKEGST